MGLNTHELCRLKVSYHNDLFPYKVFRCVGLSYPCHDLSLFPCIHLEFYKLVGFLHPLRAQYLADLQFDLGKVANGYEILSFGFFFFWFFFRFFFFHFFLLVFIDPREELFTL